MEVLFSEYKIKKKYSNLKDLKGTRIDIRDGLIKLWVSFEDISPSEISEIASASFTMVFKTYGSISMICFNFNGCIMIVPYNQFEISSGFMEASEYQEEEGIPLFVLIGESRTGELKKMRACALPHNFSIQLVELLKKQHDENINNYNLATFNDSVDQFFINNSLMEAFSKPGEREINCKVEKNK